MGAQSQAQGSLSLPMATNHAQSNAISSNGTITSNGNGLMGRGGGGSISRGNSLARQGSIYSVTLEDFQRSIMEPGQNVGSMNMDEFLKNIWTMEESQAMATAIVEGGEGNNHADDQGNGGVISENGGGNTLIRQPSLAKQSSISLAPSMSTKTVEEVWQIIRKDNPTWPRGSGDGEANVGNGGVPGVSSTAFGEVTLEDFLLKAGDVVLADREVTGGLPTPTYPLFPFSGNNGNAGPTDRGNDRGERMGPGSLAATLSLSPANGIGSVSDGMDAFKQAQAQAQAQVQQAQAQHQAQQQQASEHWIMNLQQQQQAQAQAQQAQAHHQAQQLFQAQAVNAMYKRAGNGGMIPNMNSNGGYSGMASALGPGLGQMGLQLGGTMALALAPNSPTPSPASDGGANGHGNGLSLSPVNYPAEGSLRGRKRGADGPNEKVVERRQRRMIKNRESAARSRARKQAYTVELEAEVYQLKEENNRLRKEREEAANTKKKLVLECLMRQELSDDKKKLRRTSTATF